MLLSLRLENIALVDSLELTFDNGFTVLTGETGAGKSILFGAIDALLGGSQGNSAQRLVRSGTHHGHIEGIFSIDNAVESWLRSQDIDNDESELVIQREWRLKNDRLISRWRINGVLVNRRQIIVLRPLLIDLTVQGQTQQLALSGQQLLWLDQFGGDSLKTTVSNVKRSWEKWKQASNTFERARNDLANNEKESEELTIFLNELNAAGLEDPDEEFKLKTEQDRLANGVRLQEGLLNLLHTLRERNDQLPAVIDQIGVCINELNWMSQVDQELTSTYEKILAIQAGFEDLIRDLDQYSILLESDPARLNLIQERLSYLKQLKRRYNSSLQELIVKKDKLSNFLMNPLSKESVERLQLQEKQVRSQRDHDNKRLTSLRAAIAKQLEKQMMQFLGALGMPFARFKVQIDSITPNESGSDLVRFLFSANPGHDLAPISEVASGGELSRFLLALKVTLSNVNNSNAFFFDEIDAGVGGRISGEIATLLKRLSLGHQVFCVTHQPVVAAAADHHFSVKKSVDKGITRSRVVSLHEIPDREIELAELAGGDLLEARLYAASLLDQHAA